MADDIALVPFEPEHRRGLLRLWERYFGRWSADRLSRRWAWQFEENPACRQRQPVITVAVQGSEVVGHISGIPLPMRFGNRSATVLAASGLVVDEGQRWLGFRLVRSLTGHPPVLATAMASGARQLFVQCGAAIVPQTRERLVLPRRQTGALTSSLRRRLPAAAASLVQPWLVRPLAAWYTTRSKSKPVPMPSRPTGVDVRPIDRFGSDYESLWRRASGSLSVTVEKTSEYMNWRYVGCPIANPTRLGLFQATGELSGVAIAVVRAEGANSLPPCERHGEIVELLYDPAQPTVLPALLRAIAWALDRQQVDSIAINGASARVSEVAREAGFATYQSDEYSAAVKLEDRGGLENLLVLGDTYLMAGDGDSLYSSGT